jgi:ABC-type multidrug transport system fused ATPase/permease subunit
VQRIGIARSLLKDAPILVFDEATSQLDSINEAKIESALQGRDQTLILVAHRLSTVRRADRILGLDGGRLVAAGNHAELLEQCDVYRRQWETQQLGLAGAKAD